jgi:alpha-N-arabinofuranosidase
MILTRDDKMLLTPTYHVFDMYKPFKDATHLPLEISAPDYQFGEYRVPGVQAAAARDAAGVVHVALVNLNPHNPAQVQIRISGVKAHGVTGQILTANAMNAINTFDKPDLVKPAAFTAAHVSGDTLGVDLPAKAVVMLALQ